MATKSMLNFEKSIPELKKLKNLKGVKRQKYLMQCSNNCIQSIVDMSYNILKGNLPLPPQKLQKIKKHKKNVVKLIATPGGVRVKRKIAIQQGGAIGGINN